MSHYMTALAMRQTGLKPAAKIVLYWLADHHNSETGRCFPSLKKLAEECEMARNTVVRQLDALEASGLITRERQTRENGSQTSTCYTLNLAVQDAPKQDSPCSKTEQHPVPKCNSPLFQNGTPLTLEDITLEEGTKGDASRLSSDRADLPARAYDIAEAVLAYNTRASRHGWPMVQKLTPSRRASLKARLKDAEGLHGWRAALDRAAASDFLCAKTAKPWTGFGFDWLIKSQNFTKLMEGNYDNRQPQGSTNAAQNTGRESITAQLIREGRI